MVKLYACYNRNLEQLVAKKKTNKLFLSIVSGLKDI